MAAVFKVYSPKVVLYTFLGVFFGPYSGGIRRKIYI